MVGERLQELRKDNKMSQKMLAKMLDISEYTISSYERNKSEPDDEIKIKIARIFDISLDYLLGLSNQIHSYKDSEVTIPNSLAVGDLAKIQDYINMVALTSRKIKVNSQDLAFYIKHL